MIRPLFPPVWDSSMLVAFRSCPQKFFRTYVQHWKPQTDSVHLIAGKAFAHGIEIARRVFFEDGGTAERAEEAGVKALIGAYGDFDCPPDSAKSLERTAGALEFYFSKYPLGSDGLTPLTFPNGKRGIEFSFANPLPIDHPTLGQPIIYSGRADLIGEFAGGNYIVDEKTTSQLGASWPRQWEMRSQFTGYNWAARESGIKTEGTIIRGVSILKTKYDTLQAITYRSPYEIDRWLNQTLRDIGRAIRLWDEGYWDYSLDNACNEYGGCSMVDICKSPSPEDWLPTYFKQQVWDPLSREETSIEQWEALWQKPII